jgi:hypothetical protein
MRTMAALSKTLFAGLTGLALAFGASTALAGEPTLECLESGGQASCVTQPSCAYECRQLGYPSGFSQCNLATGCCYCMGA